MMYINTKVWAFCSVSKWYAVSRRTSGKQPVLSRHTNSDRRRATCDPPYSRTWDSEKARLDLLHLNQLQNCYCGSQWNPMFILMEVCLFFPLNWFAWTIRARNWSCFTSIKISRILHDLPSPVQPGWSWRGFFYAVLFMIQQRSLKLWDPWASNLITHMYSHVTNTSQ